MSERLTRSRNDGCISDLRYDRWRAGELGPSAEAELRAHLAGCALCAARLQEIDAAAAAFDAAPAAELRNRHAARRRRKLLWASPWALAAAAALWLSMPAAKEPSVRLKGEYNFGFYVLHAGNVRRGGPDEPLAPGDRVRFTARASTAAYFAVLSLDSSGRANIYYPAAALAALLASDREQPLEASVVLDAVPGRERWYALFCAEPVQLAPLREALEKDGEHWQPPERCETQSLVVRKTER